MLNVGVVIYPVLKRDEGWCNSLAENNEKSKIVSESLSKLKELDRKIFITFYYNQKKIKEIAKIFKISEAKVKIILYRTRKSIKRNLKERGYNYGE